VLVNGGVLGIDTIINGSGAIIEAFYPSLEGARALADSLFGYQNRWGKLSVTMYPANYTSQVDLRNFDMSKPPGRTYRYYTGTPLYPFGYGLSLTQFDLSCSQPNNQTFNCILANIGNMDGDEVIQIYHRAGDGIRQRVDHPVPIKTLVDFGRYTVAAGQSLPFSFTLRKDWFSLFNSRGVKVHYPGVHYIIFSRGIGNDITFTFNM